MFAGATSSTPAMQAAMEAAGNANPSVSYAILMPFGIIVPILRFYFFAIMAFSLSHARLAFSAEETTGGQATATVESLSGRPCTE